MFFSKITLDNLSRYFIYISTISRYNNLDKYLDKKLDKCCVTYFFNTQRVKHEKLGLKLIINIKRKTGQLYLYTATFGRKKTGTNENKSLIIVLNSQTNT